jgi:hypothetical protein
MKVQMGNTLAHFVVGSDESPFGVHRLFDGNTHFLYQLEVTAQPVLGQITQRHNVFPGDHQHMAELQWRFVQKCYGALIGIYDMR